MKKDFKRVLSFVLSTAMLISMGLGFTFSPASAAEKNDTGIADGGFKAMVAYQTSSYDCRDGFNTDNYQGALDSLYNDWAKQNGKEVTDNYNGYNLYLNGNVPELNKKTNTLRKPENVEVCTGASVTDVKMSGDGEYTVSIKNLDLRKKAGTVQYFNNLFVSTNIPILSKDDPNANVKVEASSVMVGSNEYLDGVTVLPLKADAAKNIGSTYSFMVADGYAPEDGTKNCKFPKADPVKIDENGNELGAATDILVPNGAFDIEITFKIEGVDWTTAPAETAEPTVAPTQKTTTAPVVTPPPVVDLKTPFDVYLNANVNEALTPEEGEGTRLSPWGYTIQAACFGSQEMKEKVLSAKDEKGKNVFDGYSQDYIIEDSASANITKTGTYTLSVTARSSMDNLVDQGAIWFTVLMDGNVSSTITDFTLIGKSISVESGNYSKTYPWSSELIKDSAGVNRLTVCNQWEGGDLQEKTNTVTDTIEVVKGDKISFTFYVIETGDAEPSESPEATATTAPVVTPPPVVDLKTPFDVYLNANVNEALTPSEGEETRLGALGYTIQAACFGSEEMKGKVLSAKDEKGELVFDKSRQDYIIEDSASANITKTGTYTLSVTARSSMDNLVDQGAIWFTVLMDGNVSSTITDFTLIGKSISVESGNYSKTYPWSSELIKDSAGVNRLTVCNQWEGGDLQEKTNTVIDTIEVVKGDKISFTFYVIGTGDAEPSESPAATESAKPSESPAVMESAKPSKSPEVTESAEPSKSPEVTESTKPSESPTATASAKPSGSPEVTESAEPSKSPEVTESAKPSESPEVTESAKPSESPEVTESAKPSKSPEVTESAKPGNLPTATPSGNGNQQSNTGNNGKWDGQQDDEISVMYVTQKRDMSEKLGEEEQAVFYRSSNKKVATINANGRLVAKAAGKTTVTIGLDDGTTLIYQIVVKIPKIVLNKTKIKLSKNSVSRALRIKKKLSTDKIKSYIVRKKKIVTISKSGAIKGLKRGTTIVTVVMKSGAKASCKVTVK